MQANDINEVKRDKGAIKMKKKITFNLYVFFTFTSENSLYIIYYIPTQQYITKIFLVQGND